MAQLTMCINMKLIAIWGIVQGRWKLLTDPCLDPLPDPKALQDDPKLAGQATNKASLVHKLDIGTNEL